MENNELHTLRQLITQAAEQCQDPDLLDLVWKLLACSGAVAA